MGSHSVSFPNKPNLFLAFHCHLSRSCHCVIVSLDVIELNEWFPLKLVLSCFSDGLCLCLSPIFSPLTNAHLSFPIHPVPIGLGNRSPWAKSIIRTRPCGKARLARMSASIYGSELMKASAALFPNTFVSPIAGWLWMQKREPCLAAAAAAALGFALPMAQPLLLCTGDKNPPAESQQWTASGAANNPTRSIQCREQGLDLPEDAERDEERLRAHFSAC